MSAFGHVEFGVFIGQRIVEKMSLEFKKEIGN